MSFVVIGRLDRPPMLRFAQGEAPTVVLVVETAPLALPDLADPASDTPRAGAGTSRLATERHAVHFTGLEARMLYKRLTVDQRLLIHASPRRRRERDGEPASGIRSEMIAHTIRILPAAALDTQRAVGGPAARARHDAPAAAAGLAPGGATYVAPTSTTGREGEWRRRFLAGFFHRLRAAREEGGGGSGAAPAPGSPADGEPLASGTSS
jgi:hypothetical protein